jgi:hypothetical protein
MSLLSFKINSTSFYILSTILPSSLYLDEFYKGFIKHFLKSVNVFKRSLKVSLC